MKRVKVVDIRLKIIRGKPPSPTEKRFQYSTLIEYVLEGKEDGEHLVMGITPPTYFFLKQVLKQELTDLERVIYHNIRIDSRKFLQELLIQNNLLNINLKKALIESVDEVVIDNLNKVGLSAPYKFSASLYLNNGERIPNIIPSDAIIFALLANKTIFITEAVLQEKGRLDKLFFEKLQAKKDSGLKKELPKKKPDLPKGIYI